MVSKNTRPYKAGNQLGVAIVETANILYLIDNRAEYLQGLKDIIDMEIEQVRTLRNENSRLGR